MKKLFCILCISTSLIGCIEHDMSHLKCNSSDGNLQLVKNNYIYRAEIKSTFMDCMKGNSNRDVVYNDTNELAKTCSKIAYSMYGGFDVNEGASAGYWGSIESSLKSCGEIK